MSTSQIKIKVQRKATLKVKTLSKFPSAVSGSGGIQVVNNNGAFVISPTAGVIGDVLGPGVASGVSGQLAVFSDPNHLTGTGVAALSFLSSAIQFTMDGGGASIPSGYKGSMELPFNCAIVRSTLLADVAGNFVMDIKKVAYAGYPTATSIVGAAFPTLTAAQKSQDTTLTGWTTALSKGDVLEFYVTGTPTVNNVTLSLLVTRT